MKEYIVKTYTIKFKNRTEFDKAMEMNHLAVDVCHSEMYFVYDNEYFRNRFLGFIIANTMTASGEN